MQKLYLTRTETIVIATVTAVSALVIVGVVFSIGESNWIADIWQYAVNICIATCGGS